MDISIVIPVFNEEKNVNILHSEIIKSLSGLKIKYEIIFVDDGSKDNTFANLKKLKNVTIIKFRRNFGQTAAMVAGIEKAKGKTIATMDGDLQNDPHDIAKMYKVMHKHGCDVVSGWRINRKDSFAKRILSKFANTLRNSLIHDPVHDSGCSLKLYKKECFEEIDLMGEMHRYIPALLRWKGFRICEVKVKHYPRKYGKTKYGINRLIRGFLDLFNVWFWRKYSARPLHFFGSIGLITSAFGFFCGAYAAYLRLFKGSDLSDTFLPNIAVFSMMIGVQFFVSGIMADIMIKSYFRAGRIKTFNIEQIIKK
jgi:glycosyltransferase involved in cell wall biosynthesis